MMKKTIITLVITLVLAAGVLGVVRTTYAQDIDTESVETLSEDAAVPDEVPVCEPVMAEYAYEYAYEYAVQFGDQNGETQPVMTQTQTRSRLLQEGECTGECDPIQQRLNLGAGNQGQMKMQRLQLGDGTCNGDCVPQRLNGQGN